MQPTKLVFPLYPHSIPNVLLLPKFSFFLFAGLAWLCLYAAPLVMGFMGPVQYHEGLMDSPLLTLMI